MKKKPAVFEEYPFWIVLIINLVFFTSYAIGAYIFFLVGPVCVILYIAYIVFLEFRQYRESCVSCYYYGKMCAFGKGRIAARFFEVGDPNKFFEKELSPADMIPQFLVLILPLAAGIALLLRNFSWELFVLVLLPPAIWFLGNPIVYGKLACPHCKQGRACCPANEFFSKTQSRKKK